MGHRHSVIRLALLSVIITLGSVVSASAQAQFVQTFALTSNTCRVIPSTSMGTGVWQVTGTFDATVTWTVSANGADFVAIDAFSADNPATAANSTTTTGSWGAAVAGYRQMRACVTNYTSGTVNITMSAVGTGGGGGGGGGASGAVAITDGVETASVTAGLALLVDCATCSVQGIAGGFPLASNITQLLGATPSATNAFPIIISDGTAFLTFTDAFTENYHTGAGTADVEILGIALPGATGPEGVKANNPLPVYTTATSVITAVGQTEDEDAFTSGTTKVLAMGMLAEATTDAIADGQVGAPVMTLARALRTTATGYGSGGGSPANMLSDGGGDEDKTAICTGPCTVYSIVAFNHTAASAFLRCENDTAANTTPGSETASDGEFDLEIPAATTGAGFIYPVGAGIGASYATALTCWIVSDEAATGTTDVAANDVRAQFVKVSQ